MSVVLNKEWVVNVIRLELLCEALCNNIYYIVHPNEISSKSPNTISRSWDVLLSYNLGVS
jgi:hypothetical protein